MLQGVFPVFTTWKVFTALPIFASVVALTEYLIRVFEIAIRMRFGGARFFTSGNHADDVNFVANEIVHIREVDNQGGEI